MIKASNNRLPSTAQFHAALQFLLARSGSPIYFAPRPKRITLKVARMIAKSSVRERFLI